MAASKFTFAFPFGTWPLKKCSMLPLSWVHLEVEEAVHRKCRGAYSDGHKTMATGRRRRSDSSIS